MVEKHVCKTQFELQAQLHVPSVWPIHYVCARSPFAAVFDVSSMERRRNLPAFRLTTEPNFSPSDSKEVSSWQRFEQGTVDEIDGGKMMWEEATLYHRKAQAKGEVNTSEYNCATASLPRPGHPATLPTAEALQPKLRHPRSQILPGVSRQTITSGFKLHDYSDVVRPERKPAWLQVAFTCLPSPASPQKPCFALL